jgi:uroporphyrinogen-III synthase
LKHVLITRPEPGATQTANRVMALGCVPMIAPVLTVAIRVMKAPKRVAAILLTSRNAVAACPVALHDCPVFAVGAATADCARQAGFNHVCSADADATALAALVASRLRPADGTLFLPAGQGQGFDLAAILRQSGFSVTRRVAYQAVGVPMLPEVADEGLRHGKVASALFFSGETSRHFVRLLHAKKLIEAVRNVEAVSISDKAAMPLRSLPWRRINVAAKPNQDAMLALLK